MKPPAENTYDAMQEVKELKKIPLNKKFVKDYDDIEGAFAKTAKEEGIEYDAKIAGNLINQSSPLILKLKKHFNRPRPKQLAKTMNIKIKDIEMDSMKTPSYPSGHSAQGILIAKILGDKYPKAKSAFAKTGQNISYSRNVARAHYKSDSKIGEKLGLAMYKHIKK